ncbi:MAG: hypothetical protein AABW48_05660 [Nanoarchaeota archaeon]
MNIENLVKKTKQAICSAGIAYTAMVNFACGDTYLNNYGTEESAPNTENTGDPARVICEKFISCCNQVPDETTRVDCHLTAGEYVDSSVGDCMNHFEDTYANPALECIAKTFHCQPANPFEISWNGGCNADITAL